jgi:transposase
VTATSQSAQVAEIEIDDIKELLSQAEQRTLTREECDRIFSVALSYFHMTELLADRDATIAKLRKELFGPSSEKTDKVLGKSGQETSPTVDEPDQATAGDGTKEEARPAAPPRKGHGRNGADDYVGAERIRCPHGWLKAGDRCPECQRGKLYPLAKPAVLVRVTAQAPLHACIYERDRLRCNLCLMIFTAAAPEGVGEDKYDAPSASMIALLRYGYGLPMNRIEGLQQGFGIPLPTSTQWEIVASCAAKIAPAFHELVRQAAQGEVVHNDDTSMRILELRDWLRTRPAAEDDGRTGIFTTGIVARVEDRDMAIFFTGRQHAGENLADVLRQRAAELAPAMQMCDGLSRNPPNGFEVVLGNCLAHGRRQFVNLVDRFPAECRHVIEALREVYQHDAVTKQRGMSPAERLQHHQTHSAPVMAELECWLEAQIAEHKTEPNSGLGKAIAYLLRRWDALTLFLRRPGAPLDNNVCEQALKRAILHRKNSLFYKTEHGARVGDLFMSLIHTAVLCDADPFDYLTQLQRHGDELRRNPAAWMPWNYREQLARTASGPDPPG